VLICGRARKKMRRPIDLHLAVIEPVTPSAQTPRREKQRGYIVTHSHPPPVHRLQIHRPERLDGTRTRVRTHPKAPSLTRVAALLSALLMALFPANSRRCSACLGVSSAQMRCFMQRSNACFDNPCRRQYSDGSIHFRATRRARVRLSLSRLLTGRSSASQRNGPRHDGNDGISRNLA
jgi:hypothetical protein